MMYSPEMSAAIAVIDTLESLRDLLNGAGLYLAENSALILNNDGNDQVVAVVTNFEGDWQVFAPPPSWDGPGRA
jgi:hypothetical protein